MSRVLFAPTHPPELELSEHPAERRAQVSVLKDVLRLLVEQRDSGARMLRWDFIARLASAPGFAAAADALIDEAPESREPESFSALSARRDATGVVRLPR